MRARNFEPLPAAHIPAHQLVVYAYHVIARFFETGTVMLVEISRPVLLLCPLHPANVVVVSLEAKRASKARFLDLLLFVKDIALMHI